MKKQILPIVSSVLFFAFVLVEFIYFYQISINSGVATATLVGLIIDIVLALLICLGYFLKPLRGFAPVGLVVLVGYYVLRSAYALNGMFTSLGRSFKSSSVLGLSVLFDIAIAFAFILAAVVAALSFSFQGKTRSVLVAVALGLILFAALFSFIVSPLLLAYYQGGNSAKVALVPLYEGFLYAGLAAGLYSLVRTKQS